MRSSSNHVGTILIIDDNLANLQVLFTTLKQANYHVVPAQDANSTFTRLRHFTPDLILLDIMMPDVNGFELYQRLREHQPKTLW
jgi:CheY-like chemotaxis protein